MVGDAAAPGPIKVSAATPAFLGCGGEMGARMRGHDWASTPVGPPEGWPQSLRTAVRLLLNSRQPMFIWWGPGLTQFYTDASSRTMGPERHPGALGQAGRDCWEEIWPIIGPQIGQVMAGQGSTWNEDQLVPVTRHGRREDVWWTYGYNPIDDDSQATGVGGVLVVCNDVTAEHLAREELRAAEMHWRAVFENMHEGFALCEVCYGADARPTDFRYIEVNGAASRLIGMPREQLVGQRAGEAIPGIEPFWVETYARVVETGVPAHFEYRIAVLGQWFEVFAYRTEPRRFAALFLNITERKQAEERQTLLAREVDHRAKNALAVVQAAVRLTTAGDLPAYRRAIEGRVATLARAQTLLADDRWSGADLGNLLRGELAAFLEDEAAGAEGAGAKAARDRLEECGPQAALAGPRVALPAGAAQPLAMALHELATNAVKYGALSVPGGRLAISWRLSRRPQELLRLRWVETGGPAVGRPPARRGFGSRVLDGTVRAQLAGTVTLDWQDSGLDCLLEIPLGRGAAEDPGEMPIGD